MKPIQVLPIFLSFLSLTQVNAADLKDELEMLEVKRLEVDMKMRAYADRFKELEPYYAQGDPIIGRYRNTKLAAKYAYPDNVKFYIHDNWKLFRIIEELDVLPAAKLSNEDVKVKDWLAQIMNNYPQKIRNTHCPKEPMETEQSKIPNSEDWLKKQCWDKTAEVFAEWKNYRLNLNRPSLYKGHIKDWQTDQESEFRAEDELERMAKQMITNAEWIKWFTKVIAAADAGKKPALDAAEQTRLEKGQGTWAEWGKFYMHYTRPATYTQPTGRLEFNTEKERNEANAFVKKRITWQYHDSIVRIFLKLLEDGLPQTNKAMEKVEFGEIGEDNEDNENGEDGEDDEDGEDGADGIEDMLDQGHVPTREQVENKMEIEFAEIGNNPVNDHKFGFKKTKGIDAKIALNANKPSAGRLANAQWGDRTPKEALKVLQTIEKAYDPKLHPRGRQYIISDMMRNALKMPARRTNFGPGRVRAPVDWFAAENNEPRTGPGQPRNPGNNLKLPKVQQ